MTAKPLHICLILHSTRSDNLGVGALTVSELALLRSAARQAGREVAFSIFDPKDPRPPYIGGADIEIVDANRQSMLSPRGFFALARRADIVVDVGAGDSFADIYGQSRLKRMFWLKFATHLAGTPLVMAPQTIGPFTQSASRRLARATMRRSAIVATRDRLSTDAAQDMRIGQDIVEASDLALRLPYTPPAPRAPGGPVRVGLNVSGLLMNGGYTGKNEFGLSSDYPALIRTLIGHFQAHPAGCEVHLVAHVLPDTESRTSPEDDFAAGRRLAKEFPKVIEAPRFATPSDAKSYIAGLDFFMGARMHACIAAFSSGVPVIPMAYSRKFQGLFGSLGYEHTVDCTSDTADAIFARIRDGFETRETLKAETEAALTLGLEKLGRYEAALVALMRRLS